MMNKYIHYCWFGGKDIPENLQHCIDTWHEKMPEWKLMRWDENSFDVNSTEWTRGAYAEGKYAFVSDYVRLVALSEYGGLYLDTDVELLKSLEPLAERHGNFTGYEGRDKLTSAIICVEPHHPLIQEWLATYHGKTFTHEVVSNNEANVLAMTEICRRQGLTCNNERQQIRWGSGHTLHVFPQTYFCPLDFYHNRHFTKDTHAIHYFDASWLDKETKDRITQERGLIFKVRSKVLALLSRIILL